MTDGRRCLGALLLGSPMRFLLALAAAVVLSIGPGQVATARAHALDPVLLELVETGDGRVDVTWKAPNAGIPGVDLRPNLPAECSQVSDKTSEVEEDATITRWTVDCGGPLLGRTIGITGLESTDGLLRVALAGGAVHRRVLAADRPAVTLAGEPSRLDVLRDYAVLGAEHIAGGLDHLLFVFGLLLLAAGARQLIATVTAFTLGHSVTLALAVLEVVSVPQAPVEVVIAITIYILAVELARDVGPSGSLLRRRPWAMAFAFGLLHGLGFAGALREAGLPASDVPLALFSFNVGIEAGQLVFVALALAARAALRPALASAPAWLRRVPVYAMGTVSAYWVLVRATGAG